MGLVGWGLPPWLVVVTNAGGSLQAGADERGETVDGLAGGPSQSAQDDEAEEWIVEDPGVMPRDAFEKAPAACGFGGPELGV